MYRLLAGMKERGDKVVIHRLRGQPCNRKLDEEVEQKALEILRDSKLGDCGPTLTPEYIAKKHNGCLHDSCGTIARKRIWRCWSSIFSVSDAAGVRHR